MVIPNCPIVAGASQNVKSPVVVVEQGEAWKYYAGPRKNDGTHSFRTFLRLDWLGQLRQYVDRPFNLEEIRAMVGLDGELFSETCLACGKKFTPVRWIDLLDPNLAELLASGIPLIEALQSLKNSLLCLGAFYFNGNTQGNYGVFCGSPYFYHDGQAKYLPADPLASHLACVMEGDPQKHWGTCRGVLSRAFADLGDANMEVVLTDIAKEKRVAEQLAIAQRVQAFNASRVVAKNPPVIQPVAVRKNHEARVLVFTQSLKGGDLKVILLPTNDGYLKILGGTNREASYKDENPPATGCREVLEESGLKISGPGDLRELYHETNLHHGHEQYFYFVPPGPCEGTLRTTDQQDGADLQKPPQAYSLSVALRKILPHHRKAFLQALGLLAPVFADAAMLIA